MKKNKIDGEMLKQRIYNRGYSLNSLSKEIGISDRQIRTYLKKNEMPQYMLSKINKEINKNNNAAIVFVPVCSKCRHILIEEPIDYVKKENPLEYPIKELHASYEFFEEDFEIKPYFCPNCKTVFTSIIASEKFPVNAKQLFEFADE